MDWKSVVLTWKLKNCKLNHILGFLELCTYILLLDILKYFVVRVLKHSWNLVYTSLNNFEPYSYSYKTYKNYYYFFDYTKVLQFCDWKLEIKNSLFLSKSANLAVMHAFLILLTIVSYVNWYSLFQNHIETKLKLCTYYIYHIRCTRYY